MKKRPNTKPIRKGTAKAITDKPKGKVASLPYRPHLNLFETMKRTPKKEPTNQQLGIVYNLAESISEEYRKWFHDQPQEIQLGLQKSLLGLIENQTTPCTLIDHIATHADQYVAEMATTMVKLKTRTTLAELLRELERGVAVVNELIDVHGESALVAKLDE